MKHKTIYKSTWKS